MSSNPGAVGALILVPIAIAGSVAFIAIKTTHFWHKNNRRYKAFFTWPRSDRTKQRRSDLSTSQVYADSWCDLESTRSCEEGNQIQLSPAKNTLSRTWHPHRSSRLTWSFGGSPKSRDPNHSESSRSVQTPLPVVARPERSQCQEGDPLDNPIPVAHLLRAQVGFWRSTNGGELGVLY
jgi:hypothetical protein